VNAKGEWEKWEEWEEWEWGWMTDAICWQGAWTWAETIGWRIAIGGQVVFFHNAAMPRCLRVAVPQAAVFQAAVFQATVSDGQFDTTTVSVPEGQSMKCWRLASFQWVGSESRPLVRSPSHNRLKRNGCFLQNGQDGH